MGQAGSVGPGDVGRASWALDGHPFPGATATRRTVLLLVLDNCEHLIDACARLADAVLGRCSHLHILATSREPLGVPGEVTWRVPSLALPPAGTVGRLPVETLAASEAVCLFIKCARLAQPRFTLTQQNTMAGAQVCRQLDGIPRPSSWPPPVSRR